MTEASMINPEAAETEVVDAPEETTPEVQAEPEKQDDYLYGGKYKSVDDLEKGYKELYSKYTEKRPEAPEKYEFDFSEHETLKSQEISLDDDPTYQKMVPLFKELNLTQDQANMLVSTYLETSYEAIPDQAQEIEKLGPNAQEIINRTNSFVSKNFTAEEQELAMAIGATADGVKFLDKIAKMRGEQPIPTDAADYAPKKSYQELMAEATAFLKSHPNFDIDKKAQARYERMMDEAVKLQIGSST